MRDRLIELLNKQSCPSPLLCDKNCKYAHLESCYAERVADHLLSNGIIVPPVRIGQKVYTIFGQKKYPKEWTVVGIWQSEECCRFHAFWESNGTIESSSSFEDYMIGKIVFLTKEEAEEALKGGEG
jgi:hypothetical protein